MGNDTSFAMRLFWKAVTSTATWIPVLAGGVVAATTTGMMFWVGIGAVTVGAGIAVWKLTGGIKGTAQQVVAELKKESNRSHYEFLRQLQRKLRQDKDPLTGKLLRQLRDTHKRMDQMGIHSRFKAPVWKADVKAKVLGLYESSVKSLENSYNLWTKAQQVSADETRQKMLATRSRILSEVVSSVEHLGKTLDQIQVSDVRVEVPDENLSELRQELDRGLEVAKNIEQRISELDEEIRVATTSPVD